MLTPVKTAVFVSGGGTNLQALLDARAAGKLGSADIALVVADKETAFALERAKKAGVETEVVVRKGKTQEEFEAGLTAALERKGIGLIVLAGFMCILSGNFTMLMYTDISKSALPLAALGDGLKKLGEEIGVSIHIQHEDIFNAMHKI